MADFVYGINPATEALQGKLRRPLELLVQQGHTSARLQTLIDAAKTQAVPVHGRSKADLDKLAGHSHHQGALLRLTPFPYSDLADLLAASAQAKTDPFLLVLDGITDPHNFGALVRSAECAGCQGVIVARDRSCPVTPVVEKSAAGALAHLPVAEVTNLSRALDEMKKVGIWVYGLAGDEAGELCQANLTGPIALVVGSEGQGLRPNVRKHCDGLLAIPVLGRIESLNASVAAGVALYEVVRQRQAQPANGYGQKKG